MTDTRDVVIWSADVPDWQTLDKVLSVPGMYGLLKYVKLDRLGLTRMGLDQMRRVQARGFQVFADAKIDEIPSKSLEIAKLHLAYQPWMLNVMASITSTGFMTHDDPEKIDALKRFADLCHEAGTLPCAVTVLTSKSEETAQREYRRLPIDQVLTYLELLLEAGFTDAVCSSEEIAAIRAESRFDSIGLNVPGIRMPGTSANDQSRVDTPKAALALGATRLVIGRNITDGDPVDNLRMIATHLNE